MTHVQIKSVAICTSRFPVLLVKKIFLNCLTILFIQTSISSRILPILREYRSRVKSLRYFLLRCFLTDARVEIINVKFLCYDNT